MTKHERYERAYNLAIDMMDCADALGSDAPLEPTSAFRGAAMTNGIPTGQELAEFVKWATDRMVGATPGFMAGHPVEMD